MFRQLCQRVISNLSITGKRKNNVKWSIIDTEMLFLSILESPRVFGATKILLLLRIDC